MLLFSLQFALKVRAQPERNSVKLFRVRNLWHGYDRPKMFPPPRDPGPGPKYKIC